MPTPFILNNYLLYVDTERLMASIHNSIMNDDARELARVCQEEVDLDERFSPDINAEHAGMTPLALACALNKAKLAEVGMLSKFDLINFP